MEFLNEDQEKVVKMAFICNGVDRKLVQEVLERIKMIFGDA